MATNSWFSTSGRLRLAGVLAALALGWLAFAAENGKPAAGSAAGHAPEGWATDLPATLKAAKAANEPVLIMFSASWCPPCKQMKQDVLPKPQVQAALKGWQRAYIDVDEQEAAAKEYDIQAMPTFVFLDANGKEVHRHRGGMAVPDFVAQLGAVRALASRYPALQAQADKAPANPAPHKAMGDILYDLGRMNDAAAHYARAEQLDPKNVTGAHADRLFVRGVLAASTDTLNAEKLLKEVAQRFPDSPRAGDSLYLRALLRLDDDKRTEGLALLQEYLKRYPQGAFAETAQSIVKRLQAAKAK